jgi:hypothetical protein
MYYTGIDPFTKKPVASAHNLKDRKMQRALMQFFKSENYFEVREALIQAGRADLIGGCEGLIPAQPPKEAIEARRRQANAALRNDHYHSVANPLLFPRIPQSQAAKFNRRSAASRISVSVNPGRRTAWICSASNSRRHARRLSAWLGRRAPSSHGDALR